MIIVAGTDFLVTMAGTVTKLLETTSDSLVSTFPWASTVTLGFIVVGLLVMISGLVPSSCLLFLIAPVTSCSPSGLEKTGTVLAVDPLSDSFFESLMEVSSSSPSGVSPSIAPTVTLVTSTVDFVVL